MSGYIIVVKSWATHYYYLLSFKFLIYIGNNNKLLLIYFFFQNFLNNFPSTDVFSIIARVFLFFQLLTVYPLISYMLRVQVFAALELSIYPSVLHVIALNCFVIFICILFAIFMPHIGTVIRLENPFFLCIYVLLIKSVHINILLYIQ